MIVALAGCSAPDLSSPEETPENEAPCRQPLEDLRWGVVAGGSHRNQLIWMAFDAGPAGPGLQEVGLAAAPPGHDACDALAVCTFTAHAHSDHGDGWYRGQIGFTDPGDYQVWAYAVDAAGAVHVTPAREFPVSEHRMGYHGPELCQA